MLLASSKILRMLCAHLKFTPHVNFKTLHSTPLHLIYACFPHQPGGRTKWPTVNASLYGGGTAGGIVPVRVSVRLPSGWIIFCQSFANSRKNKEASYILVSLWDTNQIIVRAPLESELKNETADFVDVAYSYLPLRSRCNEVYWIWKTSTEEENYNFIQVDWGDKGSTEAGSKLAQAKVP